MQLCRDECLQLLKSAHVGHLGMSVHAMPAVFRITFAFDGREVLFKVGAGTDFAESMAGNVVCVETDGEDWSVSITGQALVVDGWAHVHPEVVSGLRHSAASLAQ